MAITNADGSIILTTKVDTSGTKRGFREILSSSRQSAEQSRKAFEPLLQIIENQRNRLDALNKEYAELIITNKQNTKQAENLKKKIDSLTKEMQENEKVAKSLGLTSQKSFSKLGSVLSKVASRLALIFSVTALVNFSKEASNLAIEQEANVMRLIDIYGEASNAVGDFIDQNARALGMSKASATAFSSVYGNLFSVWADQKTNAELTNRYLNMTAVIASKTGRTVEDVQERIRSGLLGNTEAVEDLGVFVNVKTIEITEAFQRIADGRSWEQLTAYEQSQVRTLAILEQSTKKYGDQVADTTALTRSQFLASYQDMQVTWGQFVNVVLVPALKIVTKIMDIITAGMRAIAGLSGKTLESTENVSSSIGSSVENQNDLTDAVKDTNKELKKSLAGFDELNTLSQDTGSGAGGGGTSAVGGALGIGDLGGSFGGDGIVNAIDETMAKIMQIAGFALVAIGIILLCFGHISWGIGFIIAGAGIFAVSRATLKSNEATKKSQETMDKIIAIASVALLALGIILVCFGVVSPLSIGMIIAGAVGLVAEVALNWNAITNAVTKFFQENAGIITGVSIALLVLGVILLVTGAGAPLGIGLILAGSTGLATVVALNWNFIVDKVKEIWGKIKQFWNTYIAPVFTAKWWQDLGKRALNGLIGIFEKGINYIIGKINTFVRGIDSVISAVGSVFGADWSVAQIPKVSIPRLAQGAVIPPNREFMAVLGDQKHGTNIEAPLDTIVQAFNMALQNNGGGGFKGRIEVPVIIDGRQIALAVREAENNLGSQTVFGGFANAY